MRKPQRFFPGEDNFRNGLKTKNRKRRDDLDLTEILVQAR
jgi:hypothetical protein